jgi:hypothetical protein
MSTTVKGMRKLARLAIGLMLLTGPLQAWAAVESKGESKPPEVKVPPACIYPSNWMIRLACARRYPHLFGAPEGNQMRAVPRMKTLQNPTVNAGQEVVLEQ